MVNDVRMGMGRLALIVTSLLVAALATVLVVVQWEQANKVATSVSALGAVAAVGVAVWAALRGPTGGTIRVTHSGAATSGGGGRAVSGVRASNGSATLVATDTGDADASAGGEATTGIDRR
ncbi:hypothetical protein ABZV91_26875 [Nocardia sp. NPDC004568]|uniref:hypothetical protein n=1 Tax=Nocardia sp. NPDC004568 TaxID=3154551 RepID=UPI00339E8AF8